MVMFIYDVNVTTWLALVLNYLPLFLFFILNFFLAFDICRFCVVIRFFIPSTAANDLRLWRMSIPDIIHYIIFLS